MKCQPINHIGLVYYSYKVPYKCKNNMRKNAKMHALGNFKIMFKYYNAIGRLMKSLKIIGPIGSERKTPKLLNSRW